MNFFGFDGLSRIRWGGREGGREGGRQGGREGDDCYTYSNRYMFNSNPMIPQYLNNNLT